MLTMLMLLPAITLANTQTDSLFHLAQQSDDFEQKIEYYKTAFETANKNNDSTVVYHARQLIDFASEHDFKEGLALAYRHLAFYQLVMGEFESATDNNKTALVWYEKLDDQHAMLKVNRNLGICFERLGLADSVQYYAEQGLAIAKKSGDAEHLIMAHQRLSEFYAYNKGDLKKSLFHLDYAIDLVKKSEHKEYLLDLLYTKGAVLTTNGDLSGEGILLEAEELALQQNKNLLVYIRQVLIHIYHQKGQVSKAIGLVNKNLADAQQSNQQGRVATSHKQLGDLYNSLFEEEKAVEQFRQAIRVAEKIGLYDVKFSSLFGLAMVHKKNNELEPARQHLENAIHLADSLGNTTDAHRVLPELGKIYLGLGEIEKAQQSFSLVINNSKNLEKLHEAQAGMGQYFIQKKQYQKAKPYLLEAFSFAEEQENIFLKKATAEQLAFLSKKTQNYAEALKWTEIRIEYSDSIRLNENRAKMTAERMNAQFKSEKNLLLIEQQKKEEILQLENKQTRFVAGGIALLAVLLFVFFYNAQRQKKVISIQNKELEQVNRTKDRLFAIIGHDLRKPALSFRGISKKVNYLLQKQDYSTLEKLGAQIEQNALALNKLTDNLLNWALTQRNRMPYNPQETNVAEITEDVLSVFHATATQKDIQLQGDIPAHFTAYTDPNALRSILTNLTDNAIKYTPQGGTVRLQAFTEQHQVKIRVSDTGVGMSPQKLNEILLFKSKQSERGTAGEKGTGLGLYLVKELVEMNKGTISASSQIGQGTYFDVGFFDKSRDLMPKEKQK